jgi:hypothetical protein
MDEVDLSEWEVVEFELREVSTIPLPLDEVKK